MSGELLLKTKSGALPALALSCLLTAGLALVFLRYLPLQSGLARGAAAALLAYVLFRVLYPALSCLFPEKTDPAGTWTVTPDTLYLNETAIPRSSIRQIYCWPNRNALGQAGAGWTVNIETDRGHHLLRTLTKGEDAKRSARQLRAMVAALGYGSRWAGSEDDYDD